VPCVIPSRRRNHRESEREYNHHHRDVITRDRKVSFPITLHPSIVCHFQRKGTQLSFWLERKRDFLIFLCDRRLGKCTNKCACALCVKGTSLFFLSGHTETLSEEGGENLLPLLFPREQRHRGKEEGKSPPFERRGKKQQRTTLSLTKKRRKTDPSVVQLSVLCELSSSRHSITHTFDYCCLLLTYNRHQ